MDCSGASVGNGHCPILNFFKTRLRTFFLDYPENLLVYIDNPFYKFYTKLVAFCKVFCSNPVKLVCSKLLKILNYKHCQHSAIVPLAEEINKCLSKRHSNIETLLMLTVLRYTVTLSYFYAGEIKREAEEECVSNVVICLSQQRAKLLQKR